MSAQEKKYHTQFFKVRYKSTCIPPKLEKNLQFSKDTIKYLIILIFFSDQTSARYIMYIHVYNFDDDRFCNNFINFLTKQDVPMIVQGSNHYDACQVNDAYVQVLILIQCRYVLSPCMDINRAPNVFLWRNYKICLVNLRKQCLLYFITI